MNLIKVDGNANMTIIDTQYGKAMKIIGKNKVIISAEGREIYPKAWLNLLNNSNFNDSKTHVLYLIYMNCSDSTELIKFVEYTHVYSKKEKRDYTSSINSEIKNGWNLIEGKKGYEV